MGEFRRRRKVILIATDVAARGLDIQDIQFVVNIDVRKHLRYVLSLWSNV